jgi:catechol 2,3-dioxygenase-like lactoylglutathione lyase family enzyme
MPAGVVLFCADVPRLARFYQAVAALSPVHIEPGLTVLAGTHAEIVLHAIPPQYVEPVPVPPVAREDSYFKAYFPVDDLARTRDLVNVLGGIMYGPEKEFEHRGLRMCDAVDPEGNVIQFRVPSLRS